MPQQVYQIPHQTIEKMKAHYHHTLVEVPQGALFRAKTEHAVVTAYKSGKVLFQGSSPDTEAIKWINENKETQNSQKLKPAKKSSIYSPPRTLFTVSHIGSDEAGTGDYFGPITVACAYVKAGDIPKLKNMGVKDSKNITDKTIIRLSKEIAALKVPYSLLILHNEKYNTLQKQGWSQGKMKAMLHHHAINNLLQKIGTAPLEGILIDQFCEPNIYKRHIASENEILKDRTYFMTKAESYSIAVATGSIIARASFLNEMDRLSDEIGIPLKKGASSLVDQTIATIIQRKGEGILNTCAKLHFANTQKARKYL